MHQIDRGVLLPILLTLLSWGCCFAENRHTCPIGYTIAYKKYRSDDPVCYRLKGPEPFADKFKDCAGNLYTTKLYYSLNITDTNVVLWTDYKTMYSGGPFIDWSYSDSIGDILRSSNEVNYDPNLDDEEACVIVDPVMNFTATKCDEKHYRYCFVQPFRKENDKDDEGCEDLEDFWRFYSPRPTCLSAIRAVGWGTVRANWRQAKEICSKRGGSLLTKGWRYANDPLFSISGSEPTFPLGIVLSPDNTTLRFDSAREGDVEVHLESDPDPSWVFLNLQIPTSEWNFEDTNVTTDSTAYGALRDSFWYLVNSSFIFFDVLCERPIQLKRVMMNVTVDLEGKLVLTTNDTVDKDDIECFTDSKTYYPVELRVRYDDNADNFILSPKEDGYYWCVLIDSINHYVTESNKALFIREKQSLVNYYAVKIKFKADHKYDDLEDYLSHWRKKMEEYIFYRTKYIKVYGELEMDNQTSEQILKEFRNSNPGLRYKEKDLINKIKVKKYIRGKEALLHVQLNPEMMPVPPGTWDDIEVASMKAVYYCKGLDSVPMLPLGASTASSGCRTYTCVGDFTEGVQWVTTAATGCSPSTLPANTEIHVETDVSVNAPTVHFTVKQTQVEEPDESGESEVDGANKNKTNDTEAPFDEGDLIRRPGPTTPRPPPPDHWRTTESSQETVSTVSTPGPDQVVTVSTSPPETPTVRPPDEQLQQVLENLESIMKNGTVLIEDIDETFDQVDELLQTQDELEIPGNLLHLLDQLGGRINLNGSSSAIAIRSNIALLLADAGPASPVRGLRVAARDADEFTDSAFEIISSHINTTQLTANESEAVIYLPDSIANSSRRISFVVFRNDRAFQNSHVHYSVNSRIMSINVENLTQFDHGETVDIHLSPFYQDLDRNVSRSCAYWHFFEDGTGYWSQEGCTFIRSTGDGVLDTCRCNHLTHFAAVLVPRSMFSQNQEDILEVLSVIGCCLSMFGICMVGVTAAVFRSWRRDFSNKIWLQLCISIFLLVVCFILIVFLKFDHYNTACMLIGVALHYSVLSSFCWMLVAAVLSYRRLVIVFTRDASHKLLRASAFSWGAPCAVVGALLAIDPHSYAGQFEEKAPSGAFCYPSGLGLWLAVYAPIAIMLLANWTLFALIVRSVFASRRIQRHGDTNEAVRCASVSCLLVFLFGLPWIFGLFASNIVAAYLFTLTATYQGFVLFIFFVLGNKKTRDLWLNKLKIKQTRKVPVTSSTYTNRSTGGVGYRGEPEGTASIEANSTKPRSLASPDNSRFS